MVENIDNETWKDIIGFEGLYQVSSLGRIKSLDRHRTQLGSYKNATLKSKLLTQRSNKGYLKTTLCKDGKMYYFPTHRLVAIAYLDNHENKPEVNHIDGIKTNNFAENLEWCSSSENKIHAHENGLCNQKGSLNNSSILNELIVQEIKGLLRDKVYHKTISLKYNISLSTVEKISANVLWKHVA